MHRQPLALVAKVAENKAAPPKSGMYVSLQAYYVAARGKHKHTTGSPVGTWCNSDPDPQRMHVPPIATHRPGDAIFLAVAISSSS